MLDVQSISRTLNLVLRLHASVSLDLIASLSNKATTIYNNQELVKSIHLIESSPARLALRVVFDAITAGLLCLLLIVKASRFHAIERSSTSLLVECGGRNDKWSSNWRRPLHPQKALQRGGCRESAKLLRNELERGHIVLNYSSTRVDLEVRHPLEVRQLLSHAPTSDCQESIWRMTKQLSHFQGY